MVRRILITLVIATFVLGTQISVSSGDERSRTVAFESVSLCPASSKSIWESYQQPYPCIPMGTTLRFKVASGKIPLTYELNGTPVSFSGSEISLSKFQIGLNELASYGDFRGNRELVQIDRFIVISESSGRHSLNTEAKRYVLSLRNTASWNQVVSRNATDPQSQVIEKTGQSLNTVTAELTESDRMRFSRDRDVERIELDRIITTTATQSEPQWGLDRIDQRNLPLDDSFSYNADGTGVHIYVIDSGTRTTHEEFTGRILKSVNFSSASGIEDCDGHGTHVAGTALGTQYGVAKKAKLISVRVFGCTGSTTTSAIVRAIDWVISDHQSSTPAVANLSLGGGYSSTLNRAVERLIGDGVVTVIAAGNNGNNACNYSPSSVTAAIVVGASKQIDQDTDFSNVGSCVDLFAPGEDVISAYISSNNASVMYSGTSMAAPHVAGVAALLLQENFNSITNKSTTNSVIQNLLIEKTTKNVMSSVYGIFTPGSPYFSQNRLLYSDPATAGDEITTPPSYSGTPTITSELSIGSAATISGDTWTGSPDPELNFNWLGCTRSDSRARTGSSLPSDCASLAAPSNREYTIGADVIGKYLRAIITGTNTAGSTSVITPTTRSVVASAPVNTALPSISGSANPGSTLRGSSGSWSSSPSARYSYQWLSCTNTASTDSCSEISRANSTSYRVGTDQADRYLRFRVSASNTAGTAVAFSEPTSQVVVPPAPPTTRSSISIRGSERMGSSLTASSLSWSGLPIPTVDRQWVRCSSRISRQTTSSPSGCVDIAGATNTSYISTSEDLGYYLAIKETATNPTASLTVWSASLRRAVRN